MQYYLAHVYLGRALLAAALDFVCLVAASVLVWFTLHPAVDPRFYFLAVTVAGGANLVLLSYTGAYALTVLGSAARSGLRLLTSAGILAACGVLSVLFLRPPAPVRNSALTGFGVYLVLLVSGRIAFRLLTQKLFVERVLLVGVSDLSRVIARCVAERPNLGTEIVGFLSDEPVHQDVRFEGFPVLGPVHAIEKVIRAVHPQRIVVASKERGEHFPAEELMGTKLRGVRVESGITFYERVTGRIYMRDLRPSYLIFSEGFESGRGYRAAKRSLDFVLAGLGLLFASPLLLLAMLAVRLDSPGPAFFTQQRIGRWSKSFRLYKLRSMFHETTDGDARWTHANDHRITRVGRLLRKMRLDELPQLWNVLRGDMSLVGPRPERPEFAEDLSARFPFFRLRHSLRPGLTGWAQIRYGYVNDILGWEEKLSLDLYYLKYRSLSMDLFILWETAKTVILLRGT